MKKVTTIYANENFIAVVKINDEGNSKLYLSEKTEKDIYIEKITPAEEFLHLDDDEEIKVIYDNCVNLRVKNDKIGTIVPMLETIFDNSSIYIKSDSEYTSYSILTFYL